MTWFATAANQTAAIAAHAEVVEFVDLDFPDGHVRLHSRIGPITWGGYTWDGVGKLGSIEIGAEDTELRPVAWRLTLSGVDAELITAARGEDFHGRAVRLYRGWLDLSTMALVGTPERRRSGLMDWMQVTLGPNSATITVNCESELARWQRPRGLLYTHESQQIVYLGDRGFDMIPTIQGRVLNWVRPTLLGRVVSGLENQRARGPR